MTHVAYNTIGYGQTPIRFCHCSCLTIVELIFFRVDEMCLLNPFLLLVPHIRGQVLFEYEKRGTFSLYSAKTTLNSCSRPNTTKSICRSVCVNVICHLTCPEYCIGFKRHFDSVRKHCRKPFNIDPIMPLICYIVSATVFDKQGTMKQHKYFHLDFFYFHQHICRCHV